MSKLITRRDFLKDVGALGLLFLTPHTIYQSVAKHTFISTPVGNLTCFVGTGGTGKELGNELLKTNGFGMMNKTGHLKEKMNVHFFHASSIKILNLFLKDKELIFLAGAITDQDFWLARETILSNKPYLIMTFARSPVGTDFMKTQINPEINECWINLSSFEFNKTALNMIRDIYSSLAFQGLIGVDLADIHLVASRKRGIGHFIESCIHGHVENFKRYIHENMKAFKTANGAYIVFLYDHKMEVDIDNIDKMASGIKTIMHDDSHIFWAVDCCRDLGTDFRAAVLMTL